MNIRFLVYGIFIALLWKTESGESILLTTTLMTGFMGGFLIGKMTLGTFLGVLQSRNNGNNGTRTNFALPTLPSLPPLQLPSFPAIPALPLPNVNLSSILPSFPNLLTQLEEESLDLPSDDISGAAVAVPLLAATTTTIVPPVVTPSASLPPVYYQQYHQPNPPNLPNVYTYQYPVPFPYQTFVASTTTSRPDYQIKLPLFPIQPVDVPISLDNKIRDRFIRQLAIMDPLNCLPKIFCEVSADPYGATFIMNHAAITSVGSMNQPTVTKEEINAYEHHLHMEKLRRTTTTTTTTTTRPTTTRATTEAPQNDEEEENGSESGSEEEQEEEDVSVSAESEEEDDSFEQWRKEHDHKLEMQALEEMIDETEDPETYMHILRDKQLMKKARKKYMQKQRLKAQGVIVSSQVASREGAAFRGDELPFAGVGESESPVDTALPLNYDVPDYDLSSPYLNRRISLDDVQPPLPMEKPPAPPLFPQLQMFSRSTEPPLTDMFSDDPFFDDFGTSRRRSLNLFGNSRRSKRVKRQSFNKEDLMRKYRIAYMIAEKFKKPEICAKTFPSCPYRSDTILSVVNRMESGLMPFQLPSDNREYFNNKNNIYQFKNTLQAIERLNKATLQYQARGEPIDVHEVAEVAANPTFNIDANTSQTIVNEFQRVVAKIKTAKLKKKKTKKGKKPVENRTKYDAVHYYKKAQMDNLVPTQRVKPGLFQAKTNVRQQDDELQNRKHWDNVPSFKQTYKEMFKASKVKKEKSKSANNLSRNTIRTKSKSKKGKGRAKSKGKPKSTPKPVRKFSAVAEDDEKDAKESEEAVNAMIVQGKRHRSLGRLP